MAAYELNSTNVMEDLTLLAIEFFKSELSRGVDPTAVMGSTPNFWQTLLNKYNYVDRKLDEDLVEFQEEFLQLANSYIENAL